MNKTLKLVLCALFAALITVGTFIKIPVPLIPFTLQVLFTTLAGIILGGELGATSVLVYIALGLVGAPVFTSGGGITAVLSPSFGYIIGFVGGTFLTGKIASRGKCSFIRYLIAGAAGLLIIYAVGVPYCYLINKLYLKTDIAVWTLVLHGFIMCLPGDVIKLVLAAFLGKRLVPVVRKKRAGVKGGESKS